MPALRDEELELLTEIRCCANERSQDRTQIFDEPCHIMMMAQTIFVRAYPYDSPTRNTLWALQAPFFNIAERIRWLYRPRFFRLAGAPSSRGRSP